MHKINTLAIACASLLSSAIAHADDSPLVAFPGAEGFGKYATGGRAGSVYHVTNLNDSGTGSFRDAVSQPNRIIVFDVSGIIRPQSPITLSSNLTIAGQTAPGDGIAIYGDRLAISDKTNIICRYLRVRYGIIGTDGKDAVGISGESTNMIFDHMSVCWGRDENFSINSTSAQNITIQNSIIGQGLQNHSCGGLIQTNTENGITIYRNLYIDNKTRNPKVKGLNQFVNNVVYNWGSGAAYNMGGESEGKSLTSIENNYFIVGPVVNYQNVAQDDGTIAYGQLVEMSPTRPFTGGNSNFSTYCVGNMYDSDKDGLLGGNEITQSNWDTYCSGSPTFLAQAPESIPAIDNKMSAADAYQWVVDNVGASLPIRDEVDEYVVGELTSLGLSGTIIQDETNLTQFPVGGPGDIRIGTSLTDSDGDGMPDQWEAANGTDPSVDDAMTIAANGYANIENYINSIDSPQPFFAGPSVMRGEATTNSVTLSWSDRQDDETGFVIEQKVNSEWTALTTTEANVTSFVVNGLSEGTAYTFRMKALGADGKESVYSDELTITTKNLPALPNKCTVVTPADGEVVNTSASQQYRIEWANVEPNEDSGTSKFIVYWGTSADNLVAQNNGNPVSIKYRIMTIDPNKTYYWRIDAVNAQGTTTGDVWSFSTQTLVEKDPILYLPLDVDTKNYAPHALELAAAGTPVDAEIDNLTADFQSAHLQNGFVFPLATESTASAGLRVPYYEGLQITGGTATEGGTTVYKDPAASFTVSMWMKSAGSFYGSAYLWHKGDWSTPQWVGVEARGGVLYFVAKRGSNKQEMKIATSTSATTFSEIFDNTWHHLVFVRNQENQQMEFYLDGSLVLSNAFVKFFDYPMGKQTGITIGNSMDAGKNDEPFTGVIDEFKLFASALSLGEIRNLYKSGTTSGNTSTSAILTSVASADVVSLEYFTLGGQKVISPTNGLYVVRMQLSDGSYKSSLILKK